MKTIQSAFYPLLPHTLTKNCDNSNFTSVKLFFNALKGLLLINHGTSSCHINKVIIVYMTEVRQAVC